MADLRGQDLVRRLNYDELKDKITKEKKTKDAPYRTATIIRNSIQMKNLTFVFLISNIFIVYLLERLESEDVQCLIIFAR